MAEFSDAFELEIAHTWDGTPSDRVASLSLSITPEALRVEMNGTYVEGAHPSLPPGPTWKLWEYDVIELFIAGHDEHYFEFEFGAHGHYLGLELRGVRSIHTQLEPISYHAEYDAGLGTWRGSAEIPRAWLPTEPTRFNAFAIVGGPDERRFYALKGGAGAAPDFHRLELFRPWPACLRLTSG